MHMSQLVLQKLYILLMFLYPYVFIFPYKSFSHFDTSLFWLSAVVFLYKDLHDLIFLYSDKGTPLFVQQLFHLTTKSFSGCCHTFGFFGRDHRINVFRSCTENMWVFEWKICRLYKLWTFPLSSFSSHRPRWHLTNSCNLCATCGSRWRNYLLCMYLVSAPLCVVTEKSLSQHCFL